MTIEDMGSRLPENLVDTNNEEFVDIINRCLSNLELEKGNKKTMLNIIQMRIINDIRLGVTDVNDRLKILDNIFEKRTLLDKQTKQSIKLAYEEFFKKINHPKTRSDIESKIAQL
jgi:hypothetical protein